ncbi:TetR/AcrR family transcriptional regulator [Kitasatospora sp. NPDC058965]|uniref:TetR/AcrR family transcriptional regulator n=1 Tax=Kitasatospora sp. NPDC058965 TaxID=3346682 RepID=UPI00367D5564
MPALPRPVRRLSADDRRQQILSAARELLEQHGIEEVSVETAARAAGVSPGLLFHYFGSQRRFRHAVVDLVAQELLDSLRPDPALSPAEQLHGGIVQFIAFVSRHPSLYLTVVRHQSGGARMASLHRTVRIALAEWIVAGLASAGAPDAPAVRMAVAGWLAYMEEVVLLWLDRPAFGAVELAELCETSAYRLIEVAVADPEGWARIRAALELRPSQ